MRSLGLCLLLSGLGIAVMESPDPFSLLWVLVTLATVIEASALACVGLLLVVAGWLTANDGAGKES
jgi:hypothetical protein